MRRRPVLLLTAILVASAACHSHATPPPANAVTGSATTSSVARKKAFEAAASQLSHDVHAPRDSIVGVSQGEVTWPDGCLGCPKPKESCAQVLTPGYKVVLRVGDATYEYHTDLGGTARLCSQSPSGAPPSGTRGTVSSRADALSVSLARLRCEASRAAPRTRFGES